MADKGAPQCRKCLKFLPDGFEDFNECIACWALRLRAEESRPHYNAPRYTSPLQRLAEHNG